MTIKELYETLADPAFQDHFTGDLFFKAYMYMYEPEKEYSIREEIRIIKTRLKRPNNFIDVLVIDIFQLFQEYLKTRSFGNKTKYDYMLDVEEKDGDKVMQSLKRETADPKFYEYLNTEIRNHFNTEDMFKKSYVFVHGFGQIYPYLRTSNFINRFEKYITDYKIVLFYPGTYKGDFELFGMLDDKNPYRTIKLINEI